MKIAWPSVEAHQAAYDELAIPEPGKCLVERMVTVINRHGGWISEWDEGWRQKIEGLVPDHPSRNLLDIRNSLWRRIFRNSGWRR